MHPTDNERSEAISPELALVSPELAEAQRMRLPNRPWEVALERLRALPVRGVDVDSSGATPGGRRPAPAALEMPEVRPSTTEVAGAQPISTMGEARLGRFARNLLLVAVTAGALTAVMNRVDVWRGGDEEAVLPPKPHVQPSPVQSKVKTPTSLLPSAGYVVSPSGSFMTDPSGRTIERFTLPLRCGSRELVVENIRVSGISFRFTGRTVGGTRVHLTGRLLDRERMRGFVSASGSGCRTPRVAFAARLS